MGKIKGWKKKGTTEKGINWHSGTFYRSKKGSYISFNQIQDRDGKNGFIYSSHYLEAHIGIVKKVLIAKGRTEELVIKKTHNFMRANPNG